LYATHGLTRASFTTSHRHQAANFKLCRTPGDPLRVGWDDCGNMQTESQGTAATPCTVLGAIALAIASSAEVADDHPRSGKLYGARDADFIEYFCSPLTAQTIECQFTKVIVRKKAANGHTCFCKAMRGSTPSSPTQQTTAAWSMWRGSRKT
jgi:hypothetical protein